MSLFTQSTAVPMTRTDTQKNTKITAIQTKSNKANTHTKGKPTGPRRPVKTPVQFVCLSLSTSLPLDNIRVMVIVWTLRGNIITQNSSVLDGVTQCSQSAAHLCEQFLQVQQIGFVTLGPLRCA